MREILLFTARLRMPRSVPDKEKRARIEAMLSQMGLLEVCMSYVKSVLDICLEH